MRVTHGSASLHGEETGENGESQEKVKSMAQRELKIVLGEDYNNPVGSILVDASTTAHECRDLIESSPTLAKFVEGFSYNILFNGVPLKLSEEHSMKAIEFLPLMAVQVSAKQESKEVSAKLHQEVLLFANRTIPLSNHLFKLTKKYEELLVKYQTLVKEVEATKESLQELSRLRLECEQYKKRIQELEELVGQ